jgi:hypothetical protein
VGDRAISLHPGSSSLCIEVSSQATPPVIHPKTFFPC